MRSHEIPKKISEIIDCASKDVYRDQDLPSWSACNLGECLLTAWAVEQAQGVIDNGGFQYLFENDWPNNPPYSVFIDAFRNIGATEAADCIEDAVKMFPSDEPHLDYQMRRQHMDFLREKEGERDSVMDKLGSRVIDLGGDTLTRLADYILAHADYFPTVKKNIKQDA